MPILSWQTAPNFWWCWVHPSAPRRCERRVLRVVLRDSESALACEAGALSFVPLRPLSVCVQLTPFQRAFPNPLRFVSRKGARRQHIAPHKATASASECDSEAHLSPCPTLFFGGNTIRRPGGVSGGVSSLFLSLISPLQRGFYGVSDGKKGCRTRITARITARFGQPAQACPPSPRSPSVNAWHSVPPTVSVRSTRVRTHAHVRVPVG